MMSNLYQNDWVAELTSQNTNKLLRPPSR
jgi:hypothetical protein